MIYSKGNSYPGVLCTHHFRTMPLLSLPDELLAEIFSFINEIRWYWRQRVSLRLQLICKRLQKIIRPIVYERVSLVNTLKRKHYVDEDLPNYDDLQNQLRRLALCSRDATLPVQTLHVSSRFRGDDPYNNAMIQYWDGALKDWDPKENFGRFYEDMDLASALRYCLQKMSSTLKSLDVELYFPHQCFLSQLHIQKLPSLTNLTLKCGQQTRLMCPDVCWFLVHHPQLRDIHFESILFFDSKRLSEVPIQRSSPLRLKFDDCFMTKEALDLFRWTLQHVSPEVFLGLPSNDRGGLSNSIASCIDQGSLSVRVSASYQAEDRCARQLYQLEDRHVLTSLDIYNTQMSLLGCIDRLPLSLRQLRITFDRASEHALRGFESTLSCPLFKTALVSLVLVIQVPMGVSPWESTHRRTRDIFERIRLKLKGMCPTLLSARGHGVGHDPQCQ